METDGPVEQASKNGCNRGKQDNLQYIVIHGEDDLKKILEGYSNLQDGNKFIKTRHWNISDRKIAEIKDVSKNLDKEWNKEVTAEFAARLKAVELALRDLENLLQAELSRISAELVALRQANGTGKSLNMFWGETEQGKELLARLYHLIDILETSLEGKGNNFTTLWQKLFR